MGRKRLFAEGQAPLRYLSSRRQEKWLESRQVKGATANADVGAQQEDKKEQQKKYIEVAKNLFQIWDADGEGSLSPDELIKAFVQIGLSQDHHFAKKIMYSIKPPPSKGGEGSEFEIKMRDFITIFRNDEVSDSVINMINQEVNSRKRKQLENLKNEKKKGEAEAKLERLSTILKKKSTTFGKESIRMGEEQHQQTKQEKRDSPMGKGGQLHKAEGAKGGQQATVKSEIGVGNNKGKDQATKMPEDVDSIEKVKALA